MVDISFGVAPDPSFSHSACPDPLQGGHRRRFFAPVRFDLERARAAAAATPRQGGLDNGGATFPPPSPEEVQERKTNPKQGASRWRLKSKIVRLLRSQDGERGPAVCGCGAAGFEQESVRIHRRSSGAGVSGTYRCDSPWLCPTCAPGRAKARQERVEAVIEAAPNCAFVTLTIRHDLGLRLADAKRILSTASRKARQGRRWRRIQAKGGILGVVQGVEVLHSKLTGWHYHAHLILPALGQDEALLEAARELIARYIEEVEALGASALMQGQDVQIVRDDEAGIYASKGSASWEVAGGAKEARGAVSRTPWDLATLATLGDEEAAALFREYAEVMPGTRSCVISAALAEALDLPEDDDVDQPGEEQLEEHDQVIGELASPIWNRILWRGKAFEVLKAVEADEEWPAVLALAQRLGAEDPPQPPPQRSADVGRIVLQARVKGCGRSNAARSAHLDAALQEEHMVATQKGHRLVVDRASLEREFIRQGLEAPLY